MGWSNRERRKELQAVTTLLDGGDILFKDKMNRLIAACCLNRSPFYFVSDRALVARLRQNGCCYGEVFISGTLHHYEFRTSGEIVLLSGPITDFSFKNLKMKKGDGISIDGIKIRAGQQVLCRYQISASSPPEK